MCILCIHVLTCACRLFGTSCCVSVAAQPTAKPSAVLCLRCHGQCVRESDAGRSAEAKWRYDVIVSQCQCYSASAIVLVYIATHGIWAREVGRLWGLMLLCMCCLQVCSWRGTSRRRACGIFTYWAVEWVSEPTERSYW